MHSEPLSEMLGNQYFMARNYAAAAVQLQGALEKHPTSKAIRRRLIVCHTQTGMIQKAFSLFRSLVKEDVDFIINTDPVDDDCPCQELVREGECLSPTAETSVDFYIKMGMLWLFCDLQRAVECFARAAAASPGDQAVLEISQLLTKRLKASYSSKITNH